MDRVSKKRTLTKEVKKIVKKPSKPNVKFVAANKPTVKRTIKKTVIKKTTKSSDTITLNKKNLSSFVKEKNISQIETETVKFIPGEVSLRLKDRLNIYSKWYSTNFNSIALPLTQIFGYLFITIGLFSAYIYTLDQNSSNLKMLANVSCVFGNCSKSTTIPPNANEQLKNNLPQISFSTLPKINLEKDTEFNVSANQLTSLSLSLIFLQTGKKIIIEPTGEVLNGRYNYLLPTKTLPSGDYKIVAYVTSVTDKIKAEFNGPTFLVPERLPLVTLATNTAAFIDEEISQQNSETEQTILKDEKVENVFLPNVSNPESIILSSTSSTVSGADKNVSINSGVYSGQKRIFLKTDETYSKVELLAQQNNSSQTFYLGEASPIEHGWLYWLNAESLPSGQYSILIQAFIDSKAVMLANIDFVNNIDEIEKPATSTENNLDSPDKSKIENFTNDNSISKNYLTSSRESLLSLILNTEETPASSLSQKIARVVLNDNIDIFNNLFKRYATIKEDTELNLVSLVEKSLDDTIFNILTKKVENGSLQSNIKDVSLALESEIVLIKEKILKLKTLEEENIESQYLIDSDTDGIVDYEETTFYKTEPKQADSDNDGVIDGIEISLGFNPLKSFPEAIINYNSSLVTPHSNSDLIGINDVTPLLVYDVGQEKPKIQSEISGHALPNSFVVIYVSTEPNILITKTNDDGAFSFTLNKEIEDGQHKVYLALIDNHGNTIVRSDTYNFTKKFVSYTKLDPNLTATVLDSEIDAVPTNMSGNTVMALGVVSLGLVLLLLAQTIRQEKLIPNR